MSKLLDAVDEIGEKIKDPREDLKQDSKLWFILLQKAYAKNHDLYCELCGFRCMGTRLKKTTKGRYVLRPDIDPTGELAWKSQEDYDQAKQRLQPYSSQIAKILEELSEEDKEPEG